MNPLILITGVNGFLGHAMWSFLQQKHEVQLVGVDLRQTAQSASMHRLDLTIPTQVKDFLAQYRPEMIIHCAGGRMTDPELCRHANVTVTETLCAALHALDIRDCRLIIPGSAAEYGLPPPSVRRIREDCPLHPLSDYGHIKRDQTQGALRWAKKGLDIVIGRIFNIMGPHTPETLAAGRFAQQIALMEQRPDADVLQTYALSGRRDFIDVRDVCAGLWALAQTGRCGEAYNVCSGQSTRLADLLERMILCSRLTDVMIDEQRGGSASYNVIGSAVKIKRTTGWVPRITLNESLRGTLDSWRSKVRTRCGS